jgi:hypothetical protein
MAEGPADRLHLAEDVGVEPGAARIANLLFPLRDIEQRLRHASSGAEQVDLEDDMSWRGPVRSSTYSSGVLETSPPSQ